MNIDSQEQNEENIFKSTGKNEEKRRIYFSKKMNQKANEDFVHQD